MLEAVYLKVVSLTYPYQRLTARISASGRDVPSPLKEKRQLPWAKRFLSPREGFPKLFHFQFSLPELLCALRYKSIWNSVCIKYLPILNLKEICLKTESYSLLYIYLLLFIKDKFECAFLHKDLNIVEYFQNWLIFWFCNHQCRECNFPQIYYTTW